MSEAIKEPTAYRVLARKYRPQDFSALIGQEALVRTLTNAFASGRIAQAWMLTGVRGVGKTTTARILARALNYKTQTIDRPSVELEPEGEHCQAIMEGRHVDVIEMDAASHTGIDDIRDLIEQSRYRPATARYKVYIIDEVHMLSTQAFNGLLKTLEEPPSHVKFIFATTEIRKVPVTVLSRCQRFDLRRVDQLVLQQHLANIARLEGIEAQSEALSMIARAGEGSVRDGLSMLDQAIAHGSGRIEAAQVSAMLGLADRSRIIDLFETIMRGRVADGLQLFKQLYDEGGDPHHIMTELAEFNHLVTRMRVTNSLQESYSLSEEERMRGAEFAKLLGLRVLSQNWQMLLKGLGEIDQAPRPYQAAEMLLIRLSVAADLPPLDEVIKNVMAQPTKSAIDIEPGEQEKKNLEPPQSETIQDTVEPVVKTMPAMVENIETPSSDTIRLDDFAAIVAHADKMRDLAFKTQLKEYVRPIRIEHGVFEFSPTAEAPRHLPNLIAKTLAGWTGQRWQVVVQDIEGGMTLNEQDQLKREALLSDAARDPQVNAILQQFPGAQIVDVRLNGGDELTDEVAFNLLDEKEEG